MDSILVGVKITAKLLFYHSEILQIITKYWLTVALK